MGLQEAVAAVRAAVEEVAGCEVDLSTRGELVDALDELEIVSCRLPAVSHRLLARLQVEATPAQLGAKSWKEVLSVRWRISRSEAGRRLTEAALLAPRPSVTGPALPPTLPATAAAQARGLINAEHVEVIRKALDRLPGFVDTATREQVEVDLVRIAVGAGPKELKDAADRAPFLLDRTAPNRRHRTRPHTRNDPRQAAPGHDDQIAGCLPPEAWAVWEAIFAKDAAPGMCNPDDEQPYTSGRRPRPRSTAITAAWLNASTTPWSRSAASP